MPEGQLIVVYDDGHNLPRRYLCAKDGDVRKVVELYWESCLDELEARRLADDLDGEPIDTAPAGIVTTYLLEHGQVGYGDRLYIEDDPSPVDW